MVFIAVCVYFSDPDPTEDAVKEWELTRCVDDVYKVMTKRYYTALASFSLNNCFSVFDTVVHCGVLLV